MTEKGYETRMPLSPPSDLAPVRSRYAQPQELRLTVVSANGQADLVSAPALRADLMHAIDEGASTLVVDLAGVTFIDSMALGVLVGAAKRLRQRNGQVRVVVDDPHIRRIFELTLLDRVFELFETRDDALVPR